MSSSIVTSLLGAIQAGLSVLLVIFYGVVATQFDLLDEHTSKKISKVCVRFFLPALLITKVGNQLDASTISDYIPIVIWALAYNIISLCIGLTTVKIFKFPKWVTPAITFNNTTSLPLLLIQSLESTGVLEVIVRKGDSTSKAVERAQTYFLVCAIIGNCLTFAVGPRLIDGENGPDEHTDCGSKKDPLEADDTEQNQVVDEEDLPGPPDEETSLLPKRVGAVVGKVHNEVYIISTRTWNKFSPRSKEVLSFCSEFLNAPLIGALIGCFIGLVPALHRAFFNDTQQGGIFTAWLTSSLKNVGNLFVTLQIVVVGVTLTHSLRKLKRGEDSGEMNWVPVMFVFMVRYVIWPAISISVIWAVASKTHLLGDDPMLWFALMVMPTGPPAMKLIAMIDASGSDEAEKMVIAKLLTLAYICSPLTAATIVGSLKASQSLMES